MDLGNILQGAGIFVCVGAILLIVLGVIAFRRAFASRPAARPTYRDDDPLVRDQGRERPRFDDNEIESSGGFGNTPSRRDRDIDNRPSGLRRDDEDRISRRRSARTNNQDDDNVRSRGGFGG